MITLKQWMEVCNYRITEGSEYMWKCFGPNAHRLDSWNGEMDGHTISILFDTRTQVVYMVEAFDYKRVRAYRMINPEFKEAYNSECVDRDIEDVAWEDDDLGPIGYVELETVDDFLEKASAIVADQDYDTRVQVPVNFSDDELLTYMKLAHERDMTFNQFVEEALRNLMDDYEKDPTGFKARMKDYSNE
jgi:hypothetical protein